MYAYIMITRPKRCFISSLYVLSGIVIALFTSNTALMFNSKIMLLLLSALLSFTLTIAAGNIINDYFDREHNKVSKPWRPIPSGRISPQTAMLYASALFLTGLFLASTINYLCFIISATNSVLLILYSRYMQNKLIAGNTIIGYISASAIIFGAASFSNIIAGTILFFITLFLLSSTELMRGLEDLEGDRKFILKSIVSGIAKRISKKLRIKGTKEPYKIQTRTKTFAFIYIIFAIFFSFLPYIWHIFGTFYLIMTLVSDIILAASLFFVLKSATRKQFIKTRNIIKKGLYVIISAFLLASVFSL